VLWAQYTDGSTRSSVFSFSIAAIVLIGEADEIAAAALIPFNLDEVHEDGGATANSYDPLETIYLDVDQSGDVSVSVPSTYWGHNTMVTAQLFDPNFVASSGSVQTKGLNYDVGDALDATGTTAVVINLGGDETGSTTDDLTSIGLSGDVGPVMFSLGFTKDNDFLGSEDLVNGRFELARHRTSIDTPTLSTPTEPSTDDDGDGVTDEDEINSINDDLDCTDGATFFTGTIDGIPDDCFDADDLIKIGLKELIDEDPSVQSAKFDYAYQVIGNTLTDPDALGGPAAIAGKTLDYSGTAVSGTPSGTTGASLVSPVDIVMTGAGTTGTVTVIADFTIDDDYLASTSPAATQASRNDCCEINC